MIGAMAFPHDAGPGGRAGSTSLGLSIRRLVPRGDRLDFEVVERKGLGHPDTICDGVAERLSLLLSRHYQAECGEVLHHNVDKVLLVGGAALPAFGGGEIIHPMELFLAGRATTSFGGKDVPLDAFATQAVGDCFAACLPTVDVARHVRIHGLIRPGSVELTHLFRQKSGSKHLSNDTSCGVGYAPLSRLETIVLAVEAALNVAARNGRPEIGSDIKVMGVRRGGEFSLTIACAIVDRYVKTLVEYLAIKDTIAGIARSVACDHGAKTVSVQVNTADDPTAGAVYLTVSGTSAEAGDDGEAGRGNRVNGLITPCRSMTMESVAGKNPVTHVGKLYNIAATLIAQRLVDDVPGIEEAECLMVGQIGGPLDRPLAMEIAVRTSRTGAAIDARIAAAAEDELSRLGAITDRLIGGELAIGRWPLRAGT